VNALLEVTFIPSFRHVEGSTGHLEEFIVIFFGYFPLEGDQEIKAFGAISSWSADLRSKSHQNK
jgi:hypothetical protein